MGPQWNAANLNKLGITLNLNEAEGRDIFYQLVEKCDVVIENFTPRVLKNFGISYETLRNVNSKIILLSMPAYGKTGPMRDQPGFAYTFEMLSGLAQVTGYRGDKPMILSGAADVIAGFHAAYAILAALEYRQRTGKGQEIELAQVEACMNLIGQPIADVSLNGRSWGRVGNRHPNMAPHGIYRCKGDDEWIAIAISNDEEWQQFCVVTSHPEWAEDERFQTSASRCQHQDELDLLIESWTLQHDHYKAASILQEAGISAGAVLEVDEMENDPFLKDMFQEMTRDLTGTHLFPSWPVKFAGKRLSHHSPAPKLGEHNEYVLKHVLGLSDDDLESLQEKEIIGTKPLGAN